MRDISKEIAIIERAQELEENKEVMDFVKEQRIFVHKGGQIRVEESLKFELSRAQMFVAALELNRPFLPEEPFESRIANTLPEAYRQVFLKAVANKNFANQQFVLGASLAEACQRLRGLISIIEGATLFNTSLTRKL